MSASAKLKLGILGSGRGSNYRSICDAIEKDALPAEVAIVLSDVEDAGILGLADQHGHAHQFIAPGQFRTKLEEAAESSYIHALQQAGVEWVVLAGFMRILKGDFLRAYTNRVINIHPSLLPSFPGLAAWRQALDYGVKVTGCTAHIVDQGIDTGTILGQRTVLILPDDSAESLHSRIQEQEHQLLPEMLRQIANGELLANQPA